MLLPRLAELELFTLLVQRLRVMMRGGKLDVSSYRVDEGRARVFVERYGEQSEVVILREDLRLDLFQANMVNLLEAGLNNENIYRVGGCTCCERGYFSYRREGPTGRQGAFVFLR